MNFEKWESDYAESCCAYTNLQSEAKTLCAATRFYVPVDY
jgi:hypothetical protein